jgi:hypothetical protein
MEHCKAMLDFIRKKAGQESDESQKFEFSFLADTIEKWIEAEPERIEVEEILKEKERKEE